jgi:hypothetical protein
VLYEFVTDVVEQQQKEFLERAIKDYKAEAAKPHRKWWHGVLEATGGAILWSLILIGAAIIAGRLGVDVIGAFERAAAVQPHNMPQPKAQP